MRTLNNKLSKVFNTPNKKAFIGFLTAGDPTADCTVDYILEMERAGADLIEIGIPFSDPTAEGVVIQDANIRALKNGMTTDGAFDIVRRVREKSQIPLAFMTYANPVFHYGYDRFFNRSIHVFVSASVDVKSLAWMPLSFPICRMKKRRKWKNRQMLTMWR